MLAAFEFDRPSGGCVPSFKARFCGVSGNTASTRQFSILSSAADADGSTQGFFNWPLIKPGLRPQEERDVTDKKAEARPREERNVNVASSAGQRGSSQSPEKVDTSQGFFALQKPPVLLSTSVFSQNKTYTTRLFDSERSARDREWQILGRNQPSSWSNVFVDGGDESCV